MASDHDEIERTEAPSPRWVAHARERGIWPRSTELTVAVSLLAGIVLLRFATGPVIDSLLEVLRHGLKLADISSTAGRMGGHWNGEFGRPFLVAIPLLLLPAIAAAVACVGQVGLRFQPENLAPNFVRFDVTQNLGRAFSGRSLVDMLLATAKWTTLLCLAAWWTWSDLVQTASAGGGDVESIGLYASGTFLRVGTKVAFALVIVGCADYARAWWTHSDQMRMSRAELTAELREQEGDPVLRRRRRQRQLDLSQGKTDNAAKTGNLVVVGKGRLAVALRTGDGSPAVLVSKAIGGAADRLQRAARSAGARVIHRDSLARSIFRTIRPGQSLPIQLDTNLRMH
jgi:flagellar biosynthesis protein FlhB